MARFSPSAIRQLRLHIGMSQREFAAKLGVNNVTVSRWETGRFEPDKRALEDLADLACASQAGEPIDIPMPPRQREPVRPILRASIRHPERILVALSAEQIAALLAALLEGDELEPLREKIVRQIFDELSDAYVDLTGIEHDALD